jgi:formate--tetrahydrofolate ligase
MPCVVAVNHFTHDTDAEHALRRERLAGQGVSAVLVRHWAAGGRGAADLAREVVRLCERPNRFAFVYEDSDSPWEKMHRLPVCSEPRRALRVRRAQFSRPD